MAKSTRMAPSSTRRLALLIAGMLLLGPAALHAEVFTVALENGQSFDTRYRPIDAEWDPNVAMILTDQGNWIAIEKSDIVDITSTIETSGFGYRIDATTVVVGWTYNDGGDGNAEGAGGEGAVAQGGAPRAGGVSIGAAGVPSQSAVDSGPPDAGGYDIEQFVNTDAAGESGGIPVESIVYQ